MAHSHAVDESASVPEHDFRAAFRQHVNEGSVTNDRSDKALSSRAIGSKASEVKLPKAGQQTAFSKTAPEKVSPTTTAATAVTHKTSNVPKQQASASAEQQRKVKTAEPEESDNEQQPASVPLSVVGQQPVSAISPDTDDHAPSPEADVAISSASDQPQDSLPAINATSPVTGELAMAMRIDSPRVAGAESPRTGNGASAPGVSISAAPVLHSSISPSSEVAQKHEGSISPLTGTAAVVEGGVSNHAEDGDRVAAKEGTNPADFEAELAKFHSEPVRGAHVQIDGSGNQRVDIRLLERGGALSVSVRSGDALLTRALQDHSSELNARLTTEHFRTEMWTPSSGKQVLERTFEDGRGQWQGGSSGQGSPDQRQHQKQSNEPAWLEDVENHSTAFQKRIDYTWHQ